MPGLQQASYETGAEGGNRTLKVSQWVLSPPRLPVSPQPQSWCVSPDSNRDPIKEAGLSRSRLPIPASRRIKFLELVDAPERGQFQFVSRGNLVPSRGVEPRLLPLQGRVLPSHPQGIKIFKQERSALTRLLRLVRAAYKLLLTATAFRG